MNLIAEYKALAAAAAIPHETANDLNDQIFDDDSDTILVEDLASKPSQWREELAAGHWEEDAESRVESLCDATLKIVAIARQHHVTRIIDMEFP